MFHMVQALADGGMNVTSALSDATQLFNWVISCITANAVMTTAFVVTVLIPAGIMVFHRLKSTV